MKLSFWQEQSLVWWLSSLDSDLVLKFLIRLWQPNIILENGLWVPRGRICFIFDCICFNEGSLHQHFSADEVYIWNQYLLTCIFYSLRMVIFHSYYHFCFSRALRTSILQNVLQHKTLILFTSSFVVLLKSDYVVTIA